ncbi:MAG TPA: hypothetical protein VKP30_01680 [Polyangiaceae bacterium]|nr:hypothetical protein [Polyangiaceae bacterium]
MSWATPSTTSVGTASAFVVERMLLPQLWLRVTATFLRIGWSKSQAHFELEDGAAYGGESRKTFGVRFGFDPSLSLRLTF